MAKVLDRNIQHGSTYYPKGSTPSKEHAEELEQYLKDEREVQLSDEEIVTSQASTSFNADDLTVAQLMKEIGELGATEDEIKEYKKLKKPELVAIHSELLAKKAQ